MVMFISTLGTTKLEIAVIATTITIKFDTSPALTIASPITSPPTIPIVGPIGAGNRIVASRITSMKSSTISASKIGRYGINSTASFTFLLSSNGKISE